jgi:hypothetical protein
VRTRGAAVGTLPAFVTIGMLIVATPGSAQTTSQATWEQATDARGFGPNVQLNGVAGLPDGRLVLVAGHINGGDARAWTSEDGATWEVSRFPRPRDVWPADLASTQAGAIAVGARSQNDQGLRWTTEDGKWGSPARTLRANFRDVLVSPDGISIVGDSIMRNGSGIPTLWRSVGDEVDPAIALLEWEATRIETDGEVTFLKHARLPTGTWLIQASEFFVETQEDVSRLYRSDDGVTWAAVDGAPDGPEGAARVADIGVGPGGFVAVGSIDETSDDRRGAIWTSADGLAWQEVASSPVALTALAVGPAGLYAFSHPWLDEATMTFVEEPAQLLHSSDGSTWTPLDATAFDGAGVHEAEVAPDGRILVLGRLVRDREFGSTQPSVWVGRPGTEPS